MEKEKITGEELKKLVEEKNDNSPIKDKDIGLYENCVIKIPDNLLGLSFVGCSFTIHKKRRTITININCDEKDEREDLYFHDCEFKSDISIHAENLKFVTFRNFSISQNSTLGYGGKSSAFIFEDSTDVKGNIINFYNKGTVKTFVNDIQSTGYIKIHDDKCIEIEDSEFNNITIGNNPLNEIKTIPNNFNIFNSKINYLNLDSLNFQDLFSIEFSTIEQLFIFDTIFNKSTSFQNTTVDTVKLDKVQFNNGTYFDDFKVLEPTKCDKTTLRTIKQELQKTENRIDYDTYRSYELEAYKKELKETEKSYYGDLLILQLNSLFSKHGINWKRALGMTLLFSLGFYSVLYTIKNLQNEFDITLNGFDHFTSGYFKFFLVTNFYDPLSENKEYLKHFREWIPFLLGKIVIGYGLFETIQSFRKYKK